MLSKAMKYTLLLVFLCSGTGTYGQSPFQEAQSALQAGNYEAAVTAYQTAVEADSANTRAWFGLGRAYHALGQYANAIEAYAIASNQGFYPQFAQYNLACSYAKAGEPDSAMAHLHQAVDAGFSNLETIQTDADLNTVREDANFTAILEGVDRNARPCEYDTSYRQLDFWIGEWDVYNPQGQLVGHNRIEKSVKGCMLIENWEGRGGSSGKSINFYDPQAEQWRQQWVGATGYIINYNGNIVDGAMSFEGTNITMDGESKLSRMTLTPKDNGNVHQLIEQSPDDGETWNVWFDGTYVPADSTKGNSG